MTKNETEKSKKAKFKKDNADARTDRQACVIVVPSLSL